MRILFLSTLILLFVTTTKAQLKANAGMDKIVCPDSSTQLGAAPVATGGTPPYTYSWYPLKDLNNSKIENPVVKPNGPIQYIVEVTDATGAIAKDSVLVSLNYINEINAGPNIAICDAGTAVLGDISNNATSGATYSWANAAGLSDVNAPRPIANVTTTTTFTLTATVVGCPAKTDIVTVLIIPTPVISAGSDVSIIVGESTLLTATGGVKYEWTPFNYLSSHLIASPIATPPVTTTYTVKGSDASGKCSATASVTVIVLPKIEVSIYNTFTPNNDFHNDKWVIVNIEKFPKNKLEVYNRYGKIVYKTSGYLNTWIGTAFGTQLPAATYFYTLTLGDGSAPKHGTVTIIH